MDYHYIYFSQLINLLRILLAISIMSSHRIRNIVTLIAGVGIGFFVGLNFPDAYY
jgi:fucose permease